MIPDYEIITLSTSLILIRWNRSPHHSTGSETAYLNELRTILNKASSPIYFLSDLRRGRITDIRVINQLVELTRHPHWAGSTAFSQSPVSRIFVGTFLKFSASDGDTKSTNEMQETPEEALAFLETLQPGLTSGIDWDRVLSFEHRV